MEAGVEKIPRADKELLIRAGNLPDDTKENRRIRKEAIADARLALRCKKAAAKYYPEGIRAFDEDKLNRLYAKEKALTEKKAVLLKDRGGKAEIKAVSAELTAVSGEIKSMQAEYRRYMESTKVYHDAKKLLTQADNYSKFSELDLRYEEFARMKTEKTE